MPNAVRRFIGNLLRLVGPFFLGSSNTGWLFLSLVAAGNSPEIDFGPASISATNPIGFIVIPYGSPQSSKKTSCGPYPLPSRYLTIR